MKDKYEVNELGEVWSLMGNRKLRKASVGKDGYCRILLRLEKGVNVTKYVHRLVWECCVGEIPAGMTVNHKDMDKGNNRLDNLELMTQAENLAHARERKKWNYEKKPVSIYRKRLMDSKWVDGYSTYKEAADSVGGNASNVFNAVKSGCVSHGYIWRKKGKKHAMEI
jgi:hypothetical protein